MHPAVRTIAGVSAYAARDANYWHQFPAVARRLRGTLAGAYGNLDTYIYLQHRNMERNSKKCQHTLKQIKTSY
jgi:uncharacterized protein (DUF1810 family)